MYLAIIIFVIILLLVILVVINFADSDVPRLVRLIVSSLIMLILAGGIYYLAAPVSTLTSIATETKPADIPDTAKETVRVTPKYIDPPETLVEYFPEDTIFSLPAEPPANERIETVTQTLTSTEVQDEFMPEEDTVSSLKVDQTETQGTETTAQTVTSTIRPIFSDTLSTSLTATESLTVEKKQ